MSFKIGIMTSMASPTRYPSQPQVSMVAMSSVTKQFSNSGGVKDLDLHVNRGRVYALLGPNGAGKSTTLKLLLGLLSPDAGRIDLFGQPWVRQALASVGATVDGPALYAHLSAGANLAVHARLLALPPARIEEVLSLVGLQAAGTKKVRSFSTGMRGRLALAVALLADPQLLILDEPQNGLDPEGIVFLRHLLVQRAQSGRTVLISSHLLGEIVHLADDVGVMVAGRLCYEGPLAGLAPDGDLEAAYFGYSTGQVL